MANLIQIDTTGCNSDYTVTLPTPSLVGKYVTVKDKGINPSFFTSNAIIIVSGQPFFGGSTAEYIRSSRGALSFITTTSNWRLLNTVPYTTLGQPTLCNMSTTHLLVYGGISTFGELITNGIRVTSIDAQVVPTINADPVMNTSNIVSTVVGLGSTGFLSSVSAMNESFTSTTQNLGGYGYISTPQIQSTIQGLGTAGYISTSWVTSTVEGLGKSYLSTPSLRSTAEGLGSVGYISSTWLTSTMEGLGTIDYISRAQLTSTVSNMLLINTSNYLSTFQKIGSNYISSSFLTNTIQNLGLSYVSAASFNSTISGAATGYETNLTSSVSGFASLGYISTYSLFSTTEGIASINQSNTANTLSSVGDTYIATSAIQSTVAGLGSLPFRYISTDSLVSTMSGLTKSNVADLTSSVINMGQYYISRAGLVSTTSGLTSNSASNITSTIDNLGKDFTYISTPSLQSTINGLASAPFNYVSTASLTSTTTGMSNAVTATNSTLIGLGSVGYVSAPSLTSTIQALGSLPYRYVSTASLVSTVQGLGTFGYISRENLNVTTNTLASLNHMPPITSTLNGLGNYYISTAVVDVYQVTTVPGISVSGVGAITSALIQSSPPTTSTVAGSTYGSANGQLGTFKSLRGIVLDSAGNIYVSDYEDNRIRRITPSGNVSTYAGSGAAGSADGNGTSATFNNPYQLAIDPLGNIYVVDRSSHKIRKIDTFRNVTTIAGSGTASEVNGQGTSATFNTPSGIAIDSAGFLYVSGVTHTIRRITPTGYVTTYAGTGSAGANDGQWNVATFNIPLNIAFGSNVLYVADTYNEKIRSITETTTVSTYAPSASTDNSGVYQYTAALAFDSSGNLYLADQTTSVIWKITDDGATITAFAGALQSQTYIDGQGGSARFNQPTALAFDTAGNMYVTDLINQRVRKIDTDGNVSTYAGSGESSSTDGIWHNASFNLPYGIAVDSLGAVYVAENAGNRIKKITNTSAVFKQYTGVYSVAVDSSSNVYALYNGQPGSTYVYAKFNSSGDLQYSSASGGFSSPSAIAVDSSGAMYVADTGNNAIKKISTNGSTVTTHIDGISEPKGLAFSGDTLYVATKTQVGKIIPAGAPTTVNIGDDYANSIAIDSSGNIYLTLPYFNQVRKYSSTGTLLNTYGHPANSSVGTSAWADSATPSAVRFNFPTAIAVASGTGNIYIADTNNHVIRQITPSGVTTTLAGTGGSAGYVNGSYLSSKFNEPYGIALDPSENAYVTDRVNCVIRKLSAGIVITYAGAEPPVGGSSVDFRNSDYNVYARTSITSYDLNEPNATIYPYGKITLDSDGNIYSINIYNRDILKISTSGQTTIYATLPTVPTGWENMQLSGIVFAPNGIIYATEQFYGLILAITSSGTTSIIAGSYKSFADGQGRQALFHTPTNIAVDTAGNLYVRDDINSRIRKIDTSGYVSTIAGNGTEGTTDGQGTNSTIFYGNGLAVDIYGYVYFSDKSTGMRMIDPSGYVSTLSWGINLANYTTPDTSQFNYPIGPIGEMAVDKYQTLYIGTADRIIKVLKDGTIYTIYSSPYGGVGRIAIDKYMNLYTINENALYVQTVYKFTRQAVAQFNNPVGITYLSSDLYVADLGNNAIRKITSSAVTTVAGLGPSSAGRVDGPTSNATFTFPYTIATYGGNLYVTETNVNNIRLINLSTNQVSTLSPYTKPTSIAFDSGGSMRVVTNGTLSVTGTSTSAAFQVIASGFTNAMSLCLDSSGNIYVADQGTNQIKRIDTSSNVTDYTTLSTAGYSNAARSNATFSSNIIGICMIGDIIYVADNGNGVIRTIHNEVVSTYATGLSPGYIAVDSSGIVYVANAAANIIRVLRYVATFVGSGSGAYADGTGTAASFNGMFQIAIDTSNNIYVADTGNRRIRKVTFVGTVTTLAGSGGSNLVNGPSATAEFNPVGVYVDSAGLVYITDRTNNTIRLIYPDGYVTSIAGSGTYGFLDGSAGIARFALPRGLVGDSSGNIYVADQGNNRLRKIALSRTVATFAGTGVSGTTNGAAASATFNVPIGIAVDGASVYVADFNPHDIRKISGGQVTTYAGSSYNAGSADGTSATFNYPRALTTDSAGNVYVADDGNYRVRKISPYSYANTIFYANTTDVYKLPLTTMTPSLFVSGQSSMYGITCDRTYVYANCYSMIKSFHMTTGAVTILAGTASPGSANGTSQASVGFDNLQSIAIDPTFSNLYVCDFNNQKVRKIQLNPLSVTTHASVVNPIGIAIDSYGTYAYVTSSMDQLYRVSLLQQNVVTFLASVSGYPQYISLDPTNTYAFIPCISANVIRQVNLLTNAVTTIAGSGAASSVDGAGTLASFNQPYGIVFNPNDAFLYSTDSGSGLLRKIATQVFLSSMIGLTQSKTVPTILPTASITTPQAYEFIHNNGGTIRTTPNLSLLGNTITAGVDIRATGYTVTAKTFTARGTVGGGYYVGDGTGVTVTSDIRTKENIQPIRNALDIVRKLQAVEYTKIDDPSRRWIGYIAQDVEQLIPHIVRTDASPEQWKSIQYTYLPGLIIEALKELKAKMDKIDTIEKVESLLIPV